MKVVTYQTTKNERIDICHACAEALLANNDWPRSATTGEEYCAVSHGLHNASLCDICGADKSADPVPNGKYYVVEIQYVGPNGRDNQYIDSHEVQIRTTPARYNQSGLPCIDNWAGTTNDWCVNAHGEFDTIEEALLAVESIFGETRDADNDQSPDIVMTLRVGALVPYAASESVEYVYGGFDAYIDADSTDEQIEDDVHHWCEQAEGEGIKLDEGAILKYAKMHRDYLMDKAI